MADPRIDKARHERNVVRAERDRFKAEREELASQVKQHRQATESRLRMLNGREAIDTMLKPDRDLYALLDRIQSEKPVGSAEAVSGLRHARGDQ